MTHARFDNHHDQLHCEGVPLATIADQVGTPVYVYSKAAIEAGYQAYDHALREQASSQAIFDARIFPQADVPLPACPRRAGHLVTAVFQRSCQQDGDCMSASPQSWREGPRVGAGHARDALALLCSLVGAGLAPHTTP